MWSLLFIDYPVGDFCILKATSQPFWNKASVSVFKYITFVNLTRLWSLELGAVVAML
jgi:hypothetical protein